MALVHPKPYLHKASILRVGWLAFPGCPPDFRSQVLGSAVRSVKTRLSSSQPVRQFSPQVYQQSLLGKRMPLEAGGLACGGFRVCSTMFRSFVCFQPVDFVGSRQLGPLLPLRPPDWLAPNGSPVNGGAQAFTPQSPCSPAPKPAETPEPESSAARPTAT